MTTLFSQPLMPVLHRAEPEPRGFVLRDYQVEDVDAVMAAWEAGKRGVVVRQATGLGKAVCIAELAARMSARGRVMVVVDVGSLAKDLYRTILKHTGLAPGSLTGDFKSHQHNAPIVVATIQTLYAGGDGDEWHRDFDPLAFSCIICDEGEASIADKYSGVIRYFLEGNPDLKACALSATPFRTDGKGMANLYDHAEDEPGPLNRDILWSVMEGWLVKPRQGFVHCALDFSTLKLRKNADGEKDFTDDDIAALMMDQDEQQWRQMAEGIHKAADGKQAIVMCPNSVEVAKVVAYHLCGAADDSGAAHPVYGAQGEKADEVMDSFKRGEFQYLVSVKKLEKGFDYDAVRYMFLLRKTKSRRLYEQFLGRGTRPLMGIRAALNAEPDPEKRRAIIANSAKPWCCLFDLVGVHPDAKDLGVIDILGTKVSAAVRERAKRNMLAAPGPGSGAADAIDVGQEARKAQGELRREAEDKAERQKRRLVQVGATVEVEIGELGELGRAFAGPMMKPGKVPATEKMVNLCIALGIPPARAVKFDKFQAGGVIGSHRKRGIEPDYRRVRQWERTGKRIVPSPPKQPAPTPLLSAMKDVPWK